MMDPGYVDTKRQTGRETDGVTGGAELSCQGNAKLPQKPKAVTIIPGSIGSTPRQQRRACAVGVSHCCGPRACCCAVVFQLQQLKVYQPSSDSLPLAQNLTLYVSSPSDARENCSRERGKPL